ncbi:hypothetical protein [Spirosoma pollinicola]|uniref:Uncharacterized protein n=1 Tax=Spirosoma pollinicola TaxID=2057025 RepID=A0A2K8YTJ3_9BACT|nr:hypothetical protein [Spirosoma pollinicola]AUD00943.1 hypothetical protein CWM47_03395 [Spirosoma pollinicola]
MKEKIRLALVNKYKNLGFSDKAIDGILAYLETSVTSEDQIDAAVTAVEGMLKAFQAEADRRATEAAAKAKEKPADPPAPAPAPAPVPDDTPAWAKALIEQNNTLSAKIAAIEMGKSADTRKSQLETALKDAPDKFKNMILKNFGLMKFDKDEDFTSFLEGVKTDSAEFIQEEANTSLSLNRRPIVASSTATGKTATDQELDSAMSILLPNAKSK